MLRPYPRAERKAVKHFEILSQSQSLDDSVSGENRSGNLVPQARWIIEPHGTIQFRVRFKSKAEGKFDSVLGFEVMGSKQMYNLICIGHCSVPRVNGDTRNVFMKRVKSVHPGAPLPHQRFVNSENFYSFGPILTFKKFDWRIAPSEGASDEHMANHSLVKTTNSDILRFTNTGSYPCKVELGFEKTTPDLKNVFFVEPCTVNLEEGETKEVTVWAFPQTPTAVYKNALIACVSNNPNPLHFEMVCSGVEPSIAIEGPWVDAIAAADAAVAAFQIDPKEKGAAAIAAQAQLKELQDKAASLKEAMTIDFDRILTDKTDYRSFTVRNTCHLPVAWELNLGDFAESPNISISPVSGVLLVGASVTIVLTFTSLAPIMLNGLFSLRYSDNERGLASADRVGTRQFRVLAEAYVIKTVSLTAMGQEEGGNEVDFGISRVGDISHQIVKISNRGKYKIAFKIHIKKQSTAAVLKVDPVEGIIDSGGTSDFKLTFCSSKKELLFKANKDIRVQISEPTEGLLGTGEMVEDFPLFVSAQAVYSKFRMQPSRGMQFGAQRF